MLELQELRDKHVPALRAWRPRARPLSILVATVTLLLLVYPFATVYPSSTRLSCLHDTCTPIRTDTLLNHVHNATLGFQRIFAITLPARTDQRDALSLAAAFVGLDVHFVDGVLGSNVSERTLPPATAVPSLPPAALGCWRAHLDVYQRMVRENIASALIMEGDADFDVRIKSQFEQFAVASRLLSQPLASSGKQPVYFDPTFPTPQNPEQPTVELDINLGPEVQLPVSSPYGDDWDLLWFGHCAGRFPDPEKDPKSPRGRVVIRNDPTVVQTQYFQKGWGSDEITTQYENHTRVIHHTAENACTLGYAVSQRAARRMLYQFGIEELGAPIDIMMRQYCDGHSERRVRNCYTAQPQYFEHFRPRGSTSRFSDISDFSGGFNEHDSSANIRLSVRGNLGALSDGKSFDELWDQYPDV